MQSDAIASASASASALVAERRWLNRLFHPDDLDAIDDYYRALDERQLVEHSAQEGSPLAHDRGQPINQADLDANQPPVTAYEDLPKVGGKVANINLAHVNSRHDIRRLLQNTETAVGGFDAARRGRISHGETEALASELGMTPEALLKRRQGQAMNAEEALAARQLLAKSGDELITLAGKVSAAKADGGASGAEGLKGDALYARVNELTHNPTDEMIDHSLDYARYVTYQRPLGKLGQGISSITQNHPILKLFLPFVRTPSNIFKFVAERSPLAPILKEWRGDFHAGGARRDLAVAKMTLGTGFGMLVAQWAADGTITGSGPLDDNAKGIMRADGWQPYSIRIGGKWHSYQRLDPIASTMGVAADLATRTQYMTDTQADEAAMLVTASILSNMGDKTWLSGVSDLVQALTDPERYSDALVKRLAGSVAVPTIIAQTARTLDPVARKTNSPLDAIKARIPGLSNSLMPMRNVWGQEIRSEGGLGPDFVSPIWTKTAKNDPLDAEMLAIGAVFGPLPRKVGGRDLSDTEYDQYQSLAGSMTEAEIRKAMMRPGWSRMSVDDRADEAEKIKTNVRKSARELLFGKLERKQVYHPAADLKALPPPPAGFVMDRP